MHESEKWKWSHSAPTTLLRSWDFPGKSTSGVPLPSLAGSLAVYKTVSFTLWNFLSYNDLMYCCIWFVNILLRIFASILIRGYWPVLGFLWSLSAFSIKAMFYSLTEFGSVLSASVFGIIWEGGVLTLNVGRSYLWNHLDLDFCFWGVCGLLIQFC